MSPFVIKPRKGAANGRESLKGVHEQHDCHHDGEDLKGIAGHVHHYSIHWDGLCGGKSKFPGFLEEEVIGFRWCRGRVRLARFSL